MTKTIDNIKKQGRSRLSDQGVSASRANSLNLPYPPPPPRKSPGAGLNQWAPPGEPPAA